MGFVAPQDDLSGVSFPDVRGDWGQDDIRAGLIELAAGNDKAGARLCFQIVGIRSIGYQDDIA
jgi:hypothetical protein